MISFDSNLKRRGRLKLLLPLVVLFASIEAAAQTEPAEPNPASEPEPEPTPPESAPAPAPAPASQDAAPADAGAASESPEDGEWAPDTTAEEPAEVTVNELGEVIVSARRRNESVQKVPVAVAVLGGQTLETKGAVSLNSFYREVPSITSYSSNARNTTINIRGLGTGITASGNGLDSGVGFYVDDVYYGRISQSILNLVDLDRIEVLRGPQGTLFGRNTTAGAISVVTRAPSFAPDGGADLSLGNYAYLQVRGSLSGPLVANELAARVSFEAQSRNGFLYDVNQLGRLHNQESFTVRGQLLYQPSANLKFRLIADFAKLGQTCCRTTPIGEVTAYDNGTPLSYTWRERVTQFPEYDLPANDPGARRSEGPRQRVFRVTLGGVLLRGDWDLGDATITSIAAFRYWNTRPRNDGDNTILDIQREGNADDSQRQFTEELRIASNGERIIDYVGGLYMLHQTVPTISRQEWGPQAGEYFIAPGTRGLTPAQRRDALNGSLTFAEYEANTLSWAAFAQGTWHILPEALDFTGGIRYTFERKWGFYGQVRGSRVDTSDLNEDQIALRNQYSPVVPYYELDKSWHSVSGTATLSVHLGQDALAFGTYSRGSKSGGLNFANLPRDEGGNLLADLAVLEPETVDHFELGLKTQWFDRRFTANASAFHTEIREYQNSFRDERFVPARNYITNVGTARSKGIELELKAVPAPGVSLYAGGTYNIAEYASYPGAQCPFELRAPGEPVACDLSGQQLPVAPKWAGAAGGDLTLPLGESLNGFLGVDYSYRSSYTTTVNNSRYSRIGDVGLVNARLGLRDPDGRWEVQIWSQNLLDKLYFVYQFADEQNGRLVGLLGDPRTYGATLRYYIY